MSQFHESAGAIFEAAIELPHEKREAFLGKACAGDLPLRRRVEALLRAHEEAESFMSGPAWRVLAKTGTLATPDQTGRRIGRYKLLQQTGEGGCGVVYLAEQDEPVRRRVALKIIKLGMDTKSVVARFEAERQALALMDHPNIAKVFDAGATETGRPYFVMELVSGIPIHRYCDQERLDTKQRLRLFVQICRAIHHAHQKGIIHRDIKPSNIMVAKQDGAAAPKIIDFGIAKATGDQRLTDKTVFTAVEQFVGTPAYMSPEQAKLSGVDIDTRSDIYSLGVLLYELLTGKTPFESKRLREAGLDEVRRIIQQEEPTPPSTRLSDMAQVELTAAAQERSTDPPRLIHLVRGDLDWIVMKALEKDRARRYESANGLAVDIERHLSGDPIEARPASTAYRFQKMVRRHKLAFAASGAVLAALIIGLGISTFSVIQLRLSARALRQALAARNEEARLRAETTRQAQTAATEAKAALATSDFLEANRLIEAGDGPDAAAFLLRILRADPDNQTALTRLGTLLTYHTWMAPTFKLEMAGWVFSAQFSPDGKRVLALSTNVTIWDAQTGQPVAGPLKHSKRLKFAQFSPDGQRIVTASEDQTARVWDAQTGQPLTEPLRHAGSVGSAQFSPDGKRIVTASEDQTARVWDAETGRLLAKPLPHAGPVGSAQFSPDGSRIVTASWDGTAQVWDAQTGDPIAKPLKHAKKLNSAKFSPDGQRIVTASEDQTARVWDAQSGEPLTGPLRHEGQVYSAQFSPDGGQIVTASEDDTAQLWDAQTGRWLTGPLRHAGPVSSAQFSPDGKCIVTASWDQTARVWDAQNGRPLVECMKIGAAMFSAQFSPDGRRIVTASADNAARVWDQQTDPPMAQPYHHALWLHAARFSPDGRRIVTASEDNTARVWDAQTGQPITEPLKHQGPVESAQFSPDGKRIVTGSRDGLAQVWDAQTGQHLGEPMRHQDRVNRAQFSPDGPWIVTASEDKTARVWDAQTGHPRTGPLEHGGTVAYAQFSPDGRRIVTAAFDNTARVWDAQTGQLLLQSLKHQEPVAFAQFSPDGKRIATASADKTARIWDAQTGQPLTGPLNHGDYVLSAQFSPDGHRLVTASRETAARVWNVETGQLVTEPLKHRKMVCDAQFSPDGKRIVTASDDHTVRLWDAQTGQPLSEPLKQEGPCYSAQFSPDGRRVLVAGRDNNARVWDIVLGPSRCPDWLLELAEALAGKRLNKQGVLQATVFNRPETISRIRQYLKNQPDDGDGVRWGRWLLADRFTRTISPCSSVTIPEYVERLISEGTDQSLLQAEQLASGNTVLPRRTLDMLAILKRASVLQSEAHALVATGQWEEAEAKSREALRSKRQPRLIPQAGTMTATGTIWRSLYRPPADASCMWMDLSWLTTRMKRPARFTTDTGELAGTTMAVGLGLTNRPVSFFRGR
jgi:WD40 repeat protein/tRNA A-37 threonylcarbamoyl transferase component Bud32